MMTLMAQARRDSGMTQDQAADRLTTLRRRADPGAARMTQSRWSRIERGDLIDLGQADYMTVFWIARTLGCQPWEIVPEAAAVVAKAEKNARRRARRRTKNK